MSQRKVITPTDLIAPLIDCQAAYDVLPVIMSPDAYPKATVAFVRWKLSESVKELRSTANYLEKKLREAELPSDTKEAP